MHNCFAVTIYLLCKPLPVWPICEPDFGHHSINTGGATSIRPPPRSLLKVYIKGLSSSASTRTVAQPSDPPCRRPRGKA